MQLFYNKIRSIVPCTISLFLILVFVCNCWWLKYMILIQLVWSIGCRNQNYDEKCSCNRGNRENLIKIVELVL